MEVEEVLRRAPLSLEAPIRRASNAVWRAEVDGLPVVYKPAAGERPLWDFPRGTLCRREVAAYVLDRVLGTGLVPPTVLRDGPLGPGSVQVYVPHDPTVTYFELRGDTRHAAALDDVATFDLVANNADRKAGHVLLGPDGVRIVDHGLCFHHQPKLRTVLWDRAGRPIAAARRRAIARLVEAPLGALEALLSPREIAALRRRAAAVAAAGTLPAAPDPYAVPWPPI